MLSLFSNKPLLDEDTTQWLFDAYAWALNNFGSDYFHAKTILVTPSNKHFPSSVNSRELLAATIFEQVTVYAGMHNWPLKLVELTPDYDPITPPSIIYNGIPRGDDTVLTLEGEVKDVEITYTMDQTRDPGVLTAVLAHHLASHLGRVSENPNPGGEKLLGHATDLLAIFMGFGLFLANNAFMVRSGCSGCGKSVQSLGFLSEDEMTYALAIFCVLKNIPNKEAFHYLKSPLRPLFKKAVKEIGNNEAAVNRLASIDRPLTTMLEN
ncbi:hypothetical protein MNBD_GAMMA26-1131 [hydrothermal vent metagenome]|uniref:Uncharacterized protein n=1 Tax=hydrothermal vent metagenome TaxID=652676 RepID=A0A3B1BCL4_9ZZZZ